MVTVTRADIADTLTVVGSVAPVNQAAAAFQVAGKVTSVSVTPGSQVSAGETLGTLDTTALSETVASDEAAVSANEAKLAEDEANQSGAGSSSNSSPASSPPKGTTTTTPPSNGGSSSGGQGNTNSATVTKDQNTLTQDEAVLSKDQQKEAADLAQAQTDCTSANTSTPAGQAACESALQTVSADEQAVSADQSTVSKDETALAQALAAESSGGAGAGGSTGNSGSASHAVANESAFTANSGTGSSPGSGGTGSTNPSSSTSGGTTGNTDTPEQIASDQAAIDTALANLTEAQQSLKEATLTSPINGTVVSVAISAGETVSAGSSTEIITILGTNSYEVEATLNSSQIPSVKVGQTASVQVDGLDGTLDGTVSQVGPVQSGSSGYSYPVIVALPASSSSEMHSGSTGNVTITTGSVSDVLAVPTSALQSFGSTSYVIELSHGQLTRKVVKVGMVGDTYTQVDSGLSPGQSVVLVDYAEAVPSSNNNTNLGNVLGGGGGAGGFFGGAGGFPVRGGAFPIQNIDGGGGGGLKGG
jgi:HlyD family secretion protein